MSEPVVHRYLLLLGSAAGDGDMQLSRAREALQQFARIEATSHIVSGPSVAPGDPSHYTNQAVRVASMLSRGSFLDALKSCERALGRDADHRGVIDLDLAREYATDGALVWENPAKLGHPLFRDLAAAVVPGVA